MTHGPEKSDLSTVAMKLTNKIGQPEAESVERRERAEGNMEGQHMRPDTEPGKRVPGA
jgi:hypothetical protein